ncbi:MAG: inositol monophosphatase [Chloroflexi bacterium]|nr:inositol monophosphatase [Chloroflexota bacterium]
MVYSLRMIEALALASQLAQETGVLLMGFYQPGGVITSLKDDRSAVTEADLAADQLIRARIGQHFPDDGLLTEEDNTIYPREKPAVWVIDPLDGTTNFSLGLHYWGVSIARLVHGEPDTGALYFPMIGELFTAQRGQGAYLNGDRLRVKSPDKNRPFTFFTCCSRTFKQYEIKVPYKARILGSAAYGLTTVARGSAVLAFEATPMVWDFAASWLVIREAGGVVRPLEENHVFPLSPGTDYASKSFPILAAATLELWDEGRSKIILKKGVRRGRSRFACAHPFFG